MTPVAPGDGDRERPETGRRASEAGGDQALRNVGRRDTDISQEPGPEGGARSQWSLETVENRRNRITAKPKETECHLK